MVGRRVVCVALVLRVFDVGDDVHVRGQAVDCVVGVSREEEVGWYSSES